MEKSKLPTASAPKHEPALWLLFREREILIKDRIQLLSKIEETGSLSGAAKSVGLSYKAAWDTIDSLNNLAEKPLVSKATGGRAGGGSLLTSYGQEILRSYRTLEAEYRRMIAKGGHAVEGLGNTARTLDRLSFKISARNQFLGTVEHLAVGLVNTEVTLRIGENMRLIALLMREGVNALGLKVGMPAIALFKATAPILAYGDAPPRTSVTNCLPGTVTEVRKGRVNAEVKLQLVENRILTTVVSLSSITDLQIKKNRRLYCIIPPSQILIALE
ncbi:MAG: TOBE domain-containing protein [Fibrobacterota bacterium]